MTIYKPVLEGAYMRSEVKFRSTMKKVLFTLLFIYFDLLIYHLFDERFALADVSFRTISFRSIVYITFYHPK